MISMRLDVPPWDTAKGSSPRMEGGAFRFLTPETDTTTVMESARVTSVRSNRRSTETSAFDGEAAHKKSHTLTTIMQIFCFNTTSSLRTQFGCEIGDLRCGIEI